MTRSAEMTKPTDEKTAIDATNAVKQALIEHGFILGIFHPEQKAMAEQLAELITPIVWGFALQYAHESFLEDPPFNGLEVLTRLQTMKGRHNGND